MLLTLLLVFPSGTPLITDPPEWDTHDLKFRSVKKLEVPGLEMPPIEVLGPIDLPAPAGTVFYAETDGTKLLVDTNGDGRPDVVCKGLGNTVNFRIGDDAEALVPYSLDLSLSDKSWHATSRCLRIGKVGKTKLSLVDANANGRFDDVGVDGVLVGKAKYARPLGRLMNIGGDVVEVEVEPFGRSMRTRPYTGELCHWDPAASFGGDGKIESLVITNADGDVFETAQKNGVDLPPGVYTFVHGAIQNGRQACEISGLDLNKRLMIGIPTDTGDALVWGSKVRLEYNWRRNGNMIQFSNIRLLGSHNERYFNFGPKPLNYKVKVADNEGNIIFEKALCFS